MIPVQKSAEQSIPGLSDFAQRFAYVQTRFKLRPISLRSSSDYTRSLIAAEVCRIGGSSDKPHAENSSLEQRFNVPFGRKNDSGNFFNAYGSISCPTAARAGRAARSKAFRTACHSICVMISLASRQYFPRLAHGILIGSSRDG
jgi:hypothetical protein